MGRGQSIEHEGMEERDMEHEGAGGGGGTGDEGVGAWEMRRERGGGTGDEGVGEWEMREWGHGK